MLAIAISGELISSEIEIRSGRGEDVQHALKLQREARRRLFALADAHGVGLASTGTHPLSDYRDQHIIDTEHYHRVQDGLQYVAHRNNTFALQVHVGVQRRRPRDPGLRPPAAGAAGAAGDQRQLAVRRRARLRPALRALADVHEVVPALRRSGPVRLAGPPGRTTSTLLLRTNSIVEYTQLWWSVRAHHAYGTIEVRICDAQTTGTEADALIELIVACVAQALREIDAGETPPDVPGRLIEENMWRAIRYGQDGKLLDLVGARSRRSIRRPRRSTG